MRDISGGVVVPFILAAQDRGRASPYQVVEEEANFPVRLAVWKD